MLTNHLLKTESKWFLKTCFLPSKSISCYIYLYINPVFKEFKYIPNLHEPSKLFKD